MTERETIQVGLVGVGALGLAVAERLLAAGYAVLGFRRSGLSQLEKAGGVAAASARAVFDTCPVVILLLPDDAALAAVMDEARDALRPGLTILCLGTHRLDVKLRAMHSARNGGAILLDGEFSGTPAMLRAGAASVLIAGEDDEVAAVSPILKAAVSAVVHVGRFGAATRMKLVTNYLVGVHTMAAAEALLLSRDLGLEPARAVEALSVTAGASTMLATRGKMMAQGNYAGGAMSGFLRFFDLLRENVIASSAVPQPTPLLDFTERLYRDAVAAGLGDQDIAAIHLSLDPEWKSRP